MELFSVIIPVYNAETYLEECITSILEQSYTHFELILINDGSSDQSKKICEEFSQKDSRIRLKHQKNAGVSAARNQGIKMALGEYVVFIDSDDYVDKRMLEKLHNSFKISGADMVICGINFVYYRSGKIQTSRTELSSYTGNVDDKLLCRNFQDMFNRNAFSSSCNKAFRSSILKMQGIRFNEKLVLYEDLEFVLSYLCYANNIFFIKEALYQYRNNLEQNHSKNRGDEDFKRIDVLVNSLTTLNSTKRKLTNESLIGLNTIIYSLYLYVMTINLSSGKYSLSKVRKMIKIFNKNAYVNEYRDGKLGVSYRYKVMDVFIQGRQALLLMIWNRLIEYWIKLRLKSKWV